MKKVVTFDDVMLGRTPPAKLSFSLENSVNVIFGEWNSSVAVLSANT